MESGLKRLVRSSIRFLLIEEWYIAMLHVGSKVVGTLRRALYRKRGAMNCAATNGAMSKDMRYWHKY